MKPLAGIKVIALENDLQSLIEAAGKVMVFPFCRGENGVLGP
jgi:hypothetical protein